jgi:hypothetical protein
MAASHNTFGDQLMNQSPFMAYYYLWACFIDNNYKYNTHTEGALTVTIWPAASALPRQNSKLFKIVYLLYTKHA